ncbi:polyhomeotic-like protein 1 isoform X3 [Zootermopsis nevadensis]|uniref:polyhomeotic-like protein 1 isoform X3 n=1 Tax=Zootermopsis nevadensis TaxID=136037 RepID=UPI000B8EDBBF|nr:polyhomeotic-like protein 1 isoform X3 [Zootermopsis nevadensis]
MVSRVCSVQNCRNSSTSQTSEEVSSTTDAAVSYHSVPWRRSHVTEKWQKLLRLPPIDGYKKRSRLRICSEHFSESNYYVFHPPSKYVKHLNILKPDAIPDRNLPDDDIGDNSESNCDKPRVPSEQQDHQPSNQRQIVPREPESNKENTFSVQECAGEGQDVEWQALDVLVREANCRREDKTELEVEEEQSQDLSPPLFVLRNKQGFAAVERPLPKLLSISMSDGKQQQSPATQPQQQTAAVLDQNVQQVQVQVQMTQQQAHDGTGGVQQPTQSQPPPGATGPPQHVVQQQQQVAVSHQQQGTPTGVTVVSSGVGGAQCMQVPSSSIQMQQQQQQQAQQQVAATMQAQTAIAPAPMPSQSGTTTITTMSTLHQPLQHPMPPPTPQPLAQHPGVPHSAQMQQVSEWGHGRVQVIQQPLQNPTYLQQLYNTQGQLLMPSNLQLHPAGMNPSSIHVITAGKPFQPNQLPPQMITTQKSVLQGQAASFPGYATIPTTTNQTLVISQLGVISNQPSILPAHSASTGAKPTDMQKYTTCGGGRTVQQSSQPMQFSPWQFAGTSLPQGITWATAAPGGIQSPTALLTAPNPIFIRGQQDGTGMFIQSPPPQLQSHNPALATQAAMPSVQQMTGKPRQTMEMPTNIQPKAAVPRALSSILPSMSGSPIRPASSVSTQTGGSAQMNATSTQVQTQKSQTKVRTKVSVHRTSPALGNATQKADAANQTKPQAVSPASQAQQMAGTKIIITSTGTAVSVGTTTSVAAGSPVLAEKLQQTGVTQSNKSMQQQPGTLQQQPQQQMQQQQMQQQPQMQHFQQQLQPQSQSQAQQAQAQQQKPIMGITTIQAQTVQVPGPPVVQQQITQQATAVTVGAPVQQMGATPPAERPIMPVVSMAPAPPPPPLQSTHPIPPNIQPCPPLVPTAGTNSNMIVPSAVPQIQTVSPQQHSSQMQPQLQTQQVQCTTVPVGSMGTQTSRDDTLSKGMEDQTSQGSGITASTPSQATPMDIQEIPDVDGSQGTGNGSISGKEEKAVNGCAETCSSTNVVENGVVVEEIRSERERDKNPPKAMVKPQVLTHVIEGFVIQEASEPFAVNRSSLLNDLVQGSKPHNQQLSDKENQQIGDGDEPPKKKHAPDLLLVPLPPGPKGELEKCEFCGKVDLRSKFKKSKRFCSMSCAKRYNVGCSKRLGMFKPNSNQSAEAQSKKGTLSDMKEQQWQKPTGKAQDWANGQPEGTTGATDENTDTNDSAASGPESSLSPSEVPDVPSVDMEDSSASESVTPATQPAQRVNPLKWTVSDVCEFIRTLPGCSDYVEDFAIQEIDGQALLLLKEDHLMTAMSMKLGPALKICAKIDTMRCDVKEK